MLQRFDVSPHKIDIKRSMVKGMPSTGLRSLAPHPFSSSMSQYQPSVVRLGLAECITKEGIQSFSCFSGSCNLHSVH